MRLTLRTMLAYLDDILDPQDTEAIARKIEESEFANELVHRTRDSMRRLRLGVPPVDGKGLATDANTVAEYLDNTLSAERVGEFEKICLESDVYLAEVASCHQILTLVLGEPAEIDPASRGRMYELASQIDAPPVQTDSMQPAIAAEVVSPASAVTPPTPPQRTKPEVPDYLRESRTRLWPVAAAAAVGALITVGLLIMFGPSEWGQRLVGIGSDEQQASEAASADGQQPDGTPDNRSSEQPPASNDPLGSGPATSTPEATPPEATPSDEAPTEPLSDTASHPETTELQRPPERPPGDPREMPDQDNPASNADAGDAPTADSAPVPAEDSLPPEPMPSDPTTDARDEGNDAVAAGGDGAQDAAFGRYTSKRGEVLLRFDRESGDWKRLPRMAPLAKGDRLLSLPFYRPTIALSTSITIQPDGAAALELIGWTPSGVPIVNIEHGRLLMMTVGKADNSIQLNFGQQQAELTFVDAESTVAIEARRMLPPGKDPTAEPANETVDLYATSGSIRVRLEDESPLDLQAPTRRALIGDGISPPGKVPSWVTSESLSGSSRRAASDVEELLPPEQFVGLVLKELSSDRRTEVRSLAIRSATYLDDFEPCIDALNEKYEKNFWPVYISDLRAAIARSPETAGRVRNSFDKQGLVGEALFRMLWGYSADDLRNGAAANLVEGLSADTLNHRVLAIWNLQDITGLPNHGYRPQNLTRQRSQAVNRWKEQLRQGKIVPRAAAAAARPSASNGNAEPSP